MNAIPENISPEAAAWCRAQLSKSRFELLLGRVLSLPPISATLYAAYSLLSKSQQERFMRWLDE